MAWTALNIRSESLRQQVRACAEATTPPASAEEFYAQQELGLLSDADLQAWIDQRFAWAGEQVQKASLDAPPLREEDLYSSPTLRWLQQNALSVEDKALAKQRYRELLFELWRKYVAQTGQAWYPPLRNDLWDRYKVIVSNPDNF